MLASLSQLPGLDWDSAGLDATQETTIFVIIELP